MLLQHSFYEKRRAKITFCTPLLSFYCFLQVAGFINTSNGNISKRPASISNINTYFEKSENKSKFFVGPTSANPGPILPTAYETTKKLVVKSYPSTLTSKSDTTNTNKYAVRNTFAERNTLCANGLSSTFIIFTFLG